MMVDHVFDESILVKLRDEKISMEDVVLLLIIGFTTTGLLIPKMLHWFVMKIGEL